MAFKFVNKIHSINARRANRKRMHRRNFEHPLKEETLTAKSDDLNNQNLSFTQTATDQTSDSNGVTTSPKINEDETEENIESNSKDASSIKDDHEDQVENVKQGPTDEISNNNDEIISSTENSSDDDTIEETKDEDSTPSLQQELRRAAAHQDSTIIVIYQDENHKSLSSPQIISGKRGETINFNFKEFDHYDLININGFTSVFVEPYGSITLTYRRQSGANIWLFSQDIDDMHMLGKPRFVSGKVDEKYSLTPPNFIGYNLLRAEGNVKGNFTDKQQVVTYYYRDATWKQVDFNVKYLKMKVSQPGFDAPKGNDTYITLAKGTVWQVFESVRLTNGERWHCLGGNLWILEDYDKVQFVDSLPQYQIDHEKDYQFSIDLSVQAIIDFVPGKKLTLYDRPFGSPVDDIEDGEIVTITERQGGREMQWFKVDNRGWTIRQYLDLDIEHKVAKDRI